MLPTQVYQDAKNDEIEKEQNNFFPDYDQVKSHGVTRLNYQKQEHHKSNMKRVLTFAQICCPKCGRCDHQGSECTGNINQFVWPYQANTVKLAGDFKQWMKNYKLEKDPKTKKFSISLILKPGQYQYKFIVDNEWKHDPNQPHISDKKGGFNNVVHVVPDKFDSDFSELDEEESMNNSFYTQDSTEGSDDNKGIVKKAKSTIVMKLPVCHYHYVTQNTKVFVHGSWNGWTQGTELQKITHQLNDQVNYAAPIKLIEGTYQYKFKIGEVWKYDPYKKRVDNKGNINNLLKVTSQKTKDLFLDPKKPCVWKKIKEINLHQIHGNTVDFIGNKIYIFGGQHKNKFQNILYTIDWNNNQIQLQNVKGKPPPQRGYHSSIVDGFKLIVFGGFNEQIVFNDFYSFDHINQKWLAQKYSNGCEIPYPREKCSLVKISHDKLILFGGFFCSSDLEYEENFNDVHCLDLIQMKWKKLDAVGDIPSPRSGHSAVAITKKHTMYVFGGFYARQGGIQQVFNDLYKIRFGIIEQPKWKLLKPKGTPPSPRYGQSASLNGNQYIIIFGGKGKKFDYFNETFMFHIQRNTWIHVKTQGQHPAGRFGHKHVMYQGKLLFLGGKKRKAFAKTSKLFVLSNLKDVNEEEEIQQNQEEKMNTIFKDNVDDDSYVVNNSIFKEEVFNNKILRRQSMMLHFNDDDIDKIIQEEKEEQSEAE